MGSFELVTVWRSDNCTQICIKFDPVTLVIDQRKVQNIPDFVFLVTGECQQCQSPESGVSSGVRCRYQWSPGQSKVTTLCLFVLINSRSELLQQSAKSAQENWVNNLSRSRVSVLSLSWVGISEPGKQRQTANVANWVENCNIYTKYCQNCQIMPPSEDCLNNFWGLCDHRQIGRNLSIDEPTSNYCQFSRWMIFCQDAKMFYIELWTGISPNMLDYGSMEKLSLNWPQRNIQGPLSKTDSGYHCANPLKCNPVTSPYCVFILHHLSWIRLFLKTFNMFFEDFFNEKKTIWRFHSSVNYWYGSS